MKTILSITPVKVEADSRTFKIAASFARFGYRSVVIEGEPSSIDKARLPFELICYNGNLNQNSIGSDAIADKKRPISLKSRFNKSLEDRFPKLHKQLHKLLYICHLLIFFKYNYESYYFPFKKRILKDFPEVSLCYLHAQSVFLAGYLKNKYKSPVIYDAHDYYLDLLDAKQEYYKIYKYYFYISERIGIKQSSAVVTVCDGVAKMMRERFSCNPIVIRNCQDSRHDLKITTDLMKLLSLPDNIFLLVVVSGSAKPGQAVSEAIDAMAHLPSNVHLAFLGKGYEKYSEDISKKDLNDRIHFVPPVRPDEVVNFIKSANASLILYFPYSLNYLNALPNGFFQSISAELPILYPEGLKEINKIAKKYDIGIPIDPKDMQTIKSGVCRLIEEPQLFKAYKQNIKKAKEELSWENEERILLGLIEKVELSR